MMPGIQEIVIIAIIVFFLFGAKRIPEFMKGLGQGIKELKNSLGPNKRIKRG